MEVGQETLAILNALVQLVTALGVILTAIASILNRSQLNKVDKKIDQVAVKAEEVKTAATAQIQTTHEATLERLDEVKDEVKQAVTDEGKRKKGH